MSYFISIKTAIVVFPLVALVFSIPFILHQYHKYGSINFLRVLIVYSFVLCLITIYFLVILPLPNRNDVVYKPDMIRLIPFGFIEDIIRESSIQVNNPQTILNFLKEPCFYTVILNIIMTIPFGMYLRYYFKCNLRKTIKMSFLLSLFFELTQLTGLYFLYPYQYRVFDVDDLMMNTIGGTIGYFLIGIIDKFLPSREEIDRESFKKGEVVSGLRRITVFVLDLFLYMFLTTFISLFIKIDHLLSIMFLFYYIVYPYLKNGETPGSKFLGVRLEINKYKLLKIGGRILFLFAYYFGSAIILFFLSTTIADIINLEVWKKIGLYSLITLGLVSFYLINSIILIKNKKMFYDNIFRVKYQSTIKKDGIYDNNIISG